MKLLTEKYCCQTAKQIKTYRILSAFFKSKSQHIIANLCSMILPVLFQASFTLATIVECMNIFLPFNIKMLSTQDKIHALNFDFQSQGGNNPAMLGDFQNLSPLFLFSFIQFSIHWNQKSQTKGNVASPRYSLLSSHLKAMF